MTAPFHWLAAAAVSIVELDAVSIGQFMISRPLVVGAGLGAATGRADIGFMVGCLVELLGLDDLPVGGHLPLNGTVAVSSCLLSALGPQRLPLELAFPAGIFFGWAHGRGESFLRQSRGRFSLSAQEALDKGKNPRFAKLSLRCAAEQVCLTAAVLAISLALIGPALSRLWSFLPGPLKTGLNFGFLVSPGLAAAGLLAALRVGK